MSFLGRIRQRKKRRVAIIGLDCAEPSLTFDRWAGVLPNLDALCQRGFYGELESVIPAITVPAWACMTSGKDPGTLGVYGFRNRSGYTYEGFHIAASSAVQEPRLWDILSQYGKESIVLGVPQTYPVRPLKGHLVSSFLTPGTHSDYTYPPELKGDIADWVGDYMFDVPGFRTSDKERLLEQIYTMTRKRFETARRLLDSRSWDFFMMVEMGVDRIHHGFWKDMDSTHRWHNPSSPYRNAILEYYQYIDSEIGTLLERFGDETVVLVVSDHGAKKMDGGICINEWLIREGYLVLAEEPDTSGGPVRLDHLKVDWSKTRAWGEGGYYGRIFFNVQGREPRGIVPPKEYDSLCGELRKKLETLEDENEQPLGTRCFTPQELYHTVRGVAPDLMVYFGDLGWRSIGTVGWDSIHVFENDTGPDDANHSQMGMFVYHDPKHDLGGRRLEGLHLMQIAPTALRLFGLDVPGDMQMPPIAEVVDAPR